MTDTKNVARYRTAIGRATLSRPMQLGLAPKSHVMLGAPGKPIPFEKREFSDYSSC